MAADRATQAPSPIEPFHAAFRGEIWYWRGPSPYYFVWVPEEICVDIRAIASDVTYGWGMIPVRGRIGATAFETSLFPKDGRYVVPVKDVVRKPQELHAGDTVEIELEIRTQPMQPRRREPSDADQVYDMDTPPSDWS
jgi:hypothetical protein